MRLFVAIDIAKEVKEKIGNVTTELPKDSIKRIKIENMHFTLRFIGEIPETQLEEITKRLGEVRFSKFKIVLSGVGVFPNENYVKIVWVGCKSKELDELAEKVIAVLKGVGKEDSRDFSAHLTIARVRRKIDVKEFLQKHKNENFDGFEVSEFKLMQSILGPEGPRYSVVAEFKAEDPNQE